MDKKILHIAIIDDGINQNLYAAGDLKHNIQITTELHINERVNYDPFLPSHGTTCAAIIKKYAPDAVLSSIKILNDDSLKGMKAQLIRALEWCVENKICLVNLSLGTIDYKDFLDVEKTIKFASENGVIIVAACNNRNVFTCPASLEYVIGVKCDISGIIKRQEYMFNTLPIDGVDITACGSHELVKYTGESKITSSCNSFATPAITALVYKLMKNNPNIGLYELKEALKQNSADYKLVECSNQLTNKLNNNINNCIDKSIEIPIIEVYNNYVNKFSGFPKNLTKKFRADGYNAICISIEEAENDLCNGLISVYSGLNNGKMSLDNNFFIERIKLICSIYDPDIIIVSIYMTNDNKYNQLEATESDLEADIKINIYENENLDIEIISINENDESNENYQTNKYNQVKNFDLNNKQIDDLYNYILSLFNITKERTDTYET